MSSVPTVPTGELGTMPVIVGRRTLRLVDIFFGGLGCGCGVRLTRDLERDVFAHEGDFAADHFQHGENDDDGEDRLHDGIFEHNEGALRRLIDERCAVIRKTVGASALVSSFTLRRTFWSDTSGRQRVG